MGCVSSAFLEEGGEDDRRRIISHHHIVSLTSSTYGILNYSSDAPAAASTEPSPSPAVAPPPPPPLIKLAAPPPPPPPPRPTNLKPQQPPPEVINSWELMAGLLDPSTPARLPPRSPSRSASTRRRRIRFPLRPIDGNSRSGSPSPAPPPVLYTTSLRGVRATFEACNAVRAALQAHGVGFRERDVSMDRGFRDELAGLCGAKAAAPALPRLFVRGRHVGGADEVLRLDEQGLLAKLLEGLPRARGGTYCCDGCGGMRFLPCFDCSGSRKLPVPVPQAASACRRRPTTVLVRCGECNENGLVLCPICS
ncbi:unnamed protein product [Urochloa decumbens]|uniref:Glutaredoxin domain-containing protein n=1 Tax=Urochloa decumbens TaxID=240449 RepID=A0ABC9GXX7_9POAL